MRVLYVDDDRINALLFEEACRVAGGIEVECAYTGDEALATVAEALPDLLVLDLHLPDTNGFALLEGLRSAIGRSTPAFLCSADEPSTLQARADAAGFQGCWPKPVDVALLVAELARWRGGNRA